VLCHNIVAWQEGAGEGWGRGGGGILSEKIGDSRHLPQGCKSRSSLFDLWSSAPNTSSVFSRQKEKKKEKKKKKIKILYSGPDWSILGISFKFSRPGARFSKAPEIFRAREAKAESRTLRLQSCFIHIILV